MRLAWATYNPVQVRPELHKTLFKASLCYIRSWLQGAERLEVVQQQTLAQQVPGSEFDPLHSLHKWIQDREGEVV